MVTYHQSLGHLAPLASILSILTSKDISMRKSTAVLNYSRTLYTITSDQNLIISFKTASDQKCPVLSTIFAMRLLTNTK